MRIVQVTQWYMPEYGYQEYFLAVSWQKIGHEVYTIAPTHVYPHTRFGRIEGLQRSRKVKPGTYEEFGTKVYRLPCIEFRHRTFLSPQLEYLVRLLRPDLVLVHGVTNLNPFRMVVLKRRMGSSFRLLCDDHMTYSVLQKGTAGRTFYSIFRFLSAKLLIPYVDVFVAVTKETKDIMINYYGISPDRIQVIPLGVPLDRFYRDEQERLSLRRQLDIADNEIMLLYAGKLNPQKGIKTLIDASLSLLPKYPKLRLIIVGSGEKDFVASQKARLREAGLSSRVAWIGLVSNDRLRPYYCAADIGVWPAEESMTMLEAAACGLPIVCKNTPANQERFGRGAGCLFSTFDEMLRHIGELIENQNLRCDMRARGRQIANQYSWNGIAQRFLDLCP